MKTAILSPIRVEPEVRRYLEEAAAFDRRPIGNFILAAALERADALRARGWKAKSPPQPRDARRKQAA